MFETLTHPHILEKIQQDFFIGNPVHVDMRLQGQGLDKNKEYVLGGRAGPEIHIDHLLHEMGHLAEREIPKLLEKPRTSWGYYLGKYDERGGFYGATNDLPIQREKRVWAYQASLVKHYGIENLLKPDFVYFWVSGAVFINAFWFYQRKISGDEETAIRHLKQEVLDLSRTDFTFERFYQAWNDRMVALKNHET